MSPYATHSVIRRTLLGTVLCALTVASCGPRRPEVDRLVLVTIDTLRADHLSLFGYQFETSPFLDSLAAQGVTFTRAYAQVPTTAPSHTSIFTSLYPMQHGVLSNVQKLDDSFLTLAEALSEAGYETAAFVSTNVHFRSGNIAQGFEVFDEHPVKKPRARRNRADKYRRADTTIDAALQWLDGRDASQKLFLWIHLFDPHSPVQPPVAQRHEIEKQYKESGKRKFLKFLRPGHGKLKKNHYRKRIRKYDAEILFADSQLRRLFEALNDPQSNDLWVVTSDHGQALYSHGRHGHSKQVYNTLLHVPLIFYSSTGQFSPAVIDDVLVEHVDLVPTLAELMGFDFSDQRGETQGESFAPRLFGERVGRQKNFSIAQNSRYPQRFSRRNSASPLKLSLQTLESKFVLNTAADDELYDLTEDPYEHQNLADAVDRQIEREKLEQALVRQVETLSIGATGEEVDEETIERLRALGYLQ